MKIAVGCILKAYGNSKESSARAVGVGRIIGYRENGVHSITIDKKFAKPF